jgi:hypothetical protein
MAIILTPADCSQGCCQIPDGGCVLTFTYVNVNLIQDDAFDIYLIKNDGTDVLAGNINGVCQSGYSDPGDDPPCDCNAEDTVTFTYTIDQTFLGNDACNSCAIQFYCIETADNGCGTYATFNITGPYGSGFGGYLGDSGFIDISTSCISST